MRTTFKKAPLGAFLIQNAKCKIICRLSSTRYIHFVNSICASHSIYRLRRFDMLTTVNDNEGKTYHSAFCPDFRYAHCRVGVPSPTEKHNKYPQPFLKCKMQNAKCKVKEGKTYHSVFCPVF